MASSGGKSLAVGHISGFQIDPNSSAVTEPDINQFLGAMNKFKADYGVFITNGRFTNKARDAAREGSPITLIDGNELIKLVIKYQQYITLVTTFVLDDFYREN